MTRLRQAAPGIELEFHGHNDLGMATANSVAALQSGADAASVTVNGLGERAGNAALEEVALALQVSCGQVLPYQFALLPEISALVARASGRSLREDKPVVGEGCPSAPRIRHPLARGLASDSATYEALRPALVGRTASRHHRRPIAPRTAWAAPSPALGYSLTRRQCFDNQPARRAPLARIANAPAVKRRIR
jgi:homocitrate synthase NifV